MSPVSQPIRAHAGSLRLRMMKNDQTSQSRSPTLQGGSDSATQKFLQQTWPPHVIRWLNPNLLDVRPSLLTSLTELKTWKSFYLSDDVTVKHDRRLLKKWFLLGASDMSRNFLDWKHQFEVKLRTKDLTVNERFQNQTNWWWLVIIRAEADWPVWWVDVKWRRTEMITHD